MYRQVFNVKNLPRSGSDSDTASTTALDGKEDGRQFAADKYEGEGDKSEAKKIADAYENVNKIASMFSMSTIHPPSPPIDPKLAPKPSVSPVHPQRVRVPIASASPAAPVAPLPVRVTTFRMDDYQKFREGQKDKGTSLDDPEDPKPVPKSAPMPVPKAALGTPLRRTDRMGIEKGSKGSKDSKHVNDMA